MLPSRNQFKSVNTTAGKCYLIGGVLKRIARYHSRTTTGKAPPNAKGKERSKPASSRQQHLTQRMRSQGNESPGHVRFCRASRVQNHAARFGTKREFQFVPKRAEKRSTQTPRTRQETETHISAMVYRSRALTLERFIITALLNTYIFIS